MLRLATCARAWKSVWLLLSVCLWYTIFLWAKSDWHTSLSVLSLPRTKGHHAGQSNKNKPNAYSCKNIWAVLQEMHTRSFASVHSHISRMKSRERADRQAFLRFSLATFSEPPAWGVRLVQETREHCVRWSAPMFKRFHSPLFAICALDQERLIQTLKLKLAALCCKRLRTVFQLWWW